jgi:hypothetical protein
MFVIGLLLYCVSINALSLEPVKMSPVVEQEFSFNVQHNNVNTGSIMQVIGGASLCEVGDNFLETISREIVLMIGSDASIRHMRWDTTITLTMGTLKVYSITANIDGLNVHIVAKHVKVEQPIPELYETKEHCERTGPRRYGIAGSRSWECNNYQVGRGLAPDEISEVNQALISKVVEAKLLV